MTDHTDDEREFEAFLKGEHALSHEYHREAGHDEVPPALDAVILRQATEQAARQQRLQAKPAPVPWYRQAWFAPVSGLAVVAMVAVVMFRPAQAPLQQQAPVALQESSAPALAEHSELPAARLQKAEEGGERLRSAEMADAEAPARPALRAAQAPAPAAPALEAPVVPEAKVMRQHEPVTDAAMTNTVMADAGAANRASLAGAVAKPAVPADWPLVQHLQALDWPAALADLDAFTPPANDPVVAVLARIRDSLLQQALPEAKDVQALYDWSLAHQSRGESHDGPTDPGH